MLLFILYDMTDYWTTMQDTGIWYHLILLINFIYRWPNFTAKVYDRRQRLGLRYFCHRAMTIPKSYLVKTISIF